MVFEPLRYVMHLPVPDYVRYGGRKLMITVVDSLVFQVRSERVDVS